MKNDLTKKLRASQELGRIIGRMQNIRTSQLTNFKADIQSMAKSIEELAELLLEELK